MANRKIAISDIHGCNRTFLELLDNIALSKSDELYLLGDYFDRGPDTKGVIDTIFKLKADGYAVRCLFGNHEEMFALSFIDESEKRRWLYNGGTEALASFGVKNVAEVPKEYRDFVRNLEFFIETDGFLLVHAGLNFFMPDPLADREGLLWERGWYENINRDWLGKRIIVHGHTPTPDLEIAQQLKQLDVNQYIDIDCGCVFAKYERYAGKGYGKLAALDLTNRELFFQKFVD